MVAIATTVAKATRAIEALVRAWMLLFVGIVSLLSDLAGVRGEG
jgi:hypothetical protein